MNRYQILSFCFVLIVMLALENGVYSSVQTADELQNYLEASEVLNPSIINALVVENETKSEYETEYEINAKYSYDQTLVFGNSEIIDPIENPRTATIEMTNLTANLLDFNQVLVPNLERNSIGDMEVSFDEGTNDLVYAVEDAKYNRYNSVILNSLIQDIQHFEYQIKELYFDFVETDFSFASLSLSFDSFQLVILLAYSDSYIDFGFALNSSGNIKLLRNYELSGKIEFNRLLEQTGEREPEILNSLTINVYSNSDYNFTINFEKINLSTIKNQTLIRINNSNYEINIGSPITMSVDSGYSLNISVINPIEMLNLKIEISFTRVELQPGKLFDDGNNSFVELIIGLNLLLPRYEYKLIFPEGFLILNENNSDMTANSNSLFLKNLEQLQEDLKVYLRFNLLHELPGLDSEIIQGKKIMYRLNTDNMQIGRMFHQQMNQSSNLTITNGQVFGFVPTFWDKGQIQIVIYNEDGYYYRDRVLLNLSPSVNFTPIQLIINPIRRSLLTIQIQNVTDGEVVNARSTYSYLNGSLRTIDGYNGMIFESGEFEHGIHILQINSTYPGLVPVSFNLELIVQEPLININIDGNFLNQSSIHLLINVPEISLINIPLIMNVTGKEINFEIQIENQYTELVLNLGHLNNETDISLNFIFYLLNYEYYQMQSILIRNTSLDLTPILNTYQTYPEQKDNPLTNVFAFLGVTSIFSLMGYGLIRVTNGKFQSNKIKF